MKKQPATRFGLTAKQISEYLGCNVPVADGVRILQVMEKSPKGLTCEECMLALGTPKTSGTSRRFYTLWQAGCLTKTSRRRPTKSGGLAQVYVLSPRASFSRYLAALHRKPKKGGESSDQNAVDTFRKQWARCKSREGKEKAIAALVQSLLSKE